MKVITALVLSALVALAVQGPSVASQSNKELWSAFLCIHRHEAPWNANSGNGYFGGLQMDVNFMEAFGPMFLRAWGTADKWPPSVQITVAINAYLSGSGFQPWSSSAHLCRLL